MGTARQPGTAKNKIMNTSLTMEEAGLALNNERPLEGTLAFLASRSRKSRELSEPASEVFKGFSGVIDQLLMNVIEKRTANEFCEAFEESFPKYAAMTMALSSIANV